jgi:drug/metabolite transporter (DMT)-like permease
MEVFSTFIKGDINPITLTIIRFLIGGITLLPLALFAQKNKGIKLHKKDFVAFVKLGVLACGISMVALQLSAYAGKPSTSAILISTNPVFVTLFSIFLFKEKITTQKVATLILGVIGICFISFSPGEGDTVLGIALGVFSSVTFAIYTIYNKRKCEEVSSIITVAYSFLLGALITLPVIFFLPEGWKLSLNLRGWLVLFYLGVLVTGLAYVFYFKAMEKLPASVGSLIFFAKPVVASLMAYFWLDDLITGRKVVGIILILVALSLPNMCKWFKSRHLEVTD